MDDFYKLSEQEQYEYEREYNEWLDRVNEQHREDFELPEDREFSEEDNTNSVENDLHESYDENYTDEDEQVVGYDDLIDTEEEYRELNFND